jgi:hypothetical protein
MWNQYKRSFWGMQLVIGLVSVAAYFGFYRSWQPTLTLFLVLHAASIGGAYWAANIRKRFQPHV